jgi:DNA topoisomerase IB
VIEVLRRRRGGPAELLAYRDRRRWPAASKRVMRAVTADVADALGDTPPVARRAYIDPRVFDRYASGWVVRLPRAIAHATPGDGNRLSDRDRRALELAVLDLLNRNGTRRTVRLS